MSERSGMQSIVKAATWHLNLSMINKDAWIDFLKNFLDETDPRDPSSPLMLKIDHSKLQEWCLKHHLGLLTALAYHELTRQQLEKPLAVKDLSVDEVKAIDELTVEILKIHSKNTPASSSLEDSILNWKGWISLAIHAEKDPLFLLITFKTLYRHAVTRWFPHILGKRSSIGNIDYFQSNQGCDDLYLSLLDSYQQHLEKNHQTRKKMSWLLTSFRDHFFSDDSLKIILSWHDLLQWATSHGLGLISALIILMKAHNLLLTSLRIEDLSQEEFQRLDELLRKYVDFPLSSVFPDSTRIPNRDDVGTYLLDHYRTKLSFRFLKKRGLSNEDIILLKKVLSKEFWSVCWLEEELTEQTPRSVVINRKEMVREITSRLCPSYDQDSLILLREFHDPKAPLWFQGESWPPQWHKGLLSWILTWQQLQLDIEDFDPSERSQERVPEDWYHFVIPKIERNLELQDLHSPLKLITNIFWNSHQVEQIKWFLYLLDKSDVTPRSIHDVLIVKHLYHHYLVDKNNAAFLLAILDYLETMVNRSLLRQALLDFNNPLAYSFDALINISERTNKSELPSPNLKQALSNYPLTSFEKAKIIEIINAFIKFYHLGIKKKDKELSMFDEFFSYLEKFLKIKNELPPFMSYLLGLQSLIAKIPHVATVFLEHATTRIPALEQNSNAKELISFQTRNYQINDSNPPITKLEKSSWLFITAQMDRKKFNEQVQQLCNMYDELEPYKDFLTKEPYHRHLHEAFKRLKKDKNSRGLTRWILYHVAATMILKDLMDQKLDQKQLKTLIDKLIIKMFPKGEKTKILDHLNTITSRLVSIDLGQLSWKHVHQTFSFLGDIHPSFPVLSCLAIWNFLSKTQRSDGKQIIIGSFPLPLVPKFFTWLDDSKNLRGFEDLVVELMEPEKKIENEELSEALPEDASLLADKSSISEEVETLSPLDNLITLNSDPSMLIPIDNGRIAWIPPSPSALKGFLGLLQDYITSEGKSSRQQSPLPEETLIEMQQLNETCNLLFHYIVKTGSSWEPLHQLITIRKNLYHLARSLRQEPRKK